jgi:hypothetical protein
LLVEVGKKSDRLYKISIPFAQLENRISSMPEDEAETVTEALIKLKNTLGEVQNHPNENNISAVTKTANWWEKLPNKTELLAVAM